MNRAKKLERRRERLGLSYQRLRDRIYDVLGPDETPSIETIRRICVDDRAHAEPLLLGTICQVLDIDLADVAPETAALLTRMRPRIDIWIDLPDQGKTDSACSPRTGPDYPQLFEPPAPNVSHQPERAVA